MESLGHRVAMVVQDALEGHSQFNTIDTPLEVIIRSDELELKIDVQQHSQEVSLLMTYSWLRE